MFEYKGYWSDVRVVFNQEDEKVFVGRVLDIKDMITFQARRLRFVEREFHKAVDDYLQFCEELGQRPSKPASREETYAVIYPFRTSPQMRQRMQKEADRARTTVNFWMEQALLHNKSEAVQRLLDNRQALDRLHSRLLPHLSRENLKSNTELFYALEQLLSGMEAMRGLLNHHDNDAFAKIVAEIETALNSTSTASNQDTVTTRDPVERESFVK